MRIPKQIVPPIPPAPAPGAEGEITAFGTVPWTRDQQAAALEEFLPVFDRRPIRDNQGGMRSVGLFNVWFLLKRLAPAAVVESGIWKGQSTWLIEQTIPGAPLLSIDPALHLREYVSGAAAYTSTDFLAVDLDACDRRFRGGLVFFDDHQDVIPRLRKCREWGIRDVILDDNYPESGGQRHLSAAACLNEKDGSGRFRFPEERRFLLENLAAYAVCPPVFDYHETVTLERSRIAGPSLMGAFDPQRHARLESYHRDMPEYRWTTYLRLK
jgi:hypothetical protein